MACTLYVLKFFFLLNRTLVLKLWKLKASTDNRFLHSRYKYKVIPYDTGILEAARSAGLLMASRVQNSLESLGK